MGRNNPGVPGSNLPAGEDWVPRRLADLERGLRELTASGVIRAGSLGNDALTSPLIPAVANMTSTAFAVTTTWAEVVGVDLVVPADCTRLLVNATGRVYAVNNSAGADSLTTRVTLDLVNGQAFVMPLAVGAWDTIGAALATLAEGLTPGGTLRLAAAAKTLATGFGANAGNTATITATLIWLR
jgi:hypothetical protein